MNLRKIFFCSVSCLDANHLHYKPSATAIAWNYPIWTGTEVWIKWIYYKFTWFTTKTHASWTFLACIVDELHLHCQFPTLLQQYVTDSLALHKNLVEVVSLNAYISWKDEAAIQPLLCASHSSLSLCNCVAISIASHSVGETLTDIMISTAFFYKSST